MILSKYSFINLPKTLSTPHVANANNTENEATITISFEDSSLEGKVTLCLSSSTDSLIYVNIYKISLFYIKEIYYLKSHPTSLLSCTGGETRTPDTWFWRPVLCQLSYTRFRLYRKVFHALEEHPLSMI